jgi:hypothetical protein
MAYLGAIGNPVKFVKLLKGPGFSQSIATHRQLENYAHTTLNQRVEGSSPPAPTNKIIEIEWN